MQPRPSPQSASRRQAAPTTLAATLTPPEPLPNPGPEPGLAPVFDARGRPPTSASRDTMRRPPSSAAALGGMGPSVRNGGQMHGPSEPPSAAQTWYPVFGAPQAPMHWNVCPGMQ